MRGRRTPRAARWSPLRFARQSALGHRRGQTLALVAVSALITACTAFAPVYDRAMQQALVDTLLAHASTDEQAVTVESEATVNAGGATEARDPRDLQALVPARRGRTARTTRAGPHRDRHPGRRRRPADRAARLARRRVRAPPRAERQPVPAAPGEILVSEADVENFGLSLGSTPTVAPAVDAPDVRLEVVGTYAPR